MKKWAITLQNIPTDHLTDYISGQLTQEWEIYHGKGTEGLMRPHSKHCGNRPMEKMNRVKTPNWKKKNKKYVYLFLSLSLNAGKFLHACFF